MLDAYLEFEKKYSGDMKEYIEAITITMTTVLTYIVLALYGSVRLIAKFRDNDDSPFEEYFGNGEFNDFRHNQKNELVGGGKFPNNADGDKKVNCEMSSLDELMNKFNRKKTGKGTGNTNALTPLQKIEKILNNYDTFKRISRCFQEDFVKLNEKIEKGFKMDNSIVKYLVLILIPVIHIAYGTLGPVYQTFKYFLSELINLFSGPSYGEIRKLEKAQESATGEVKNLNEEIEEKRKKLKENENNYLDLLKNAYNMDIITINKEHTWKETFKKGGETFKQGLIGDGEKGFLNKLRKGRLMKILLYIVLGWILTSTLREIDDTHIKQKHVGDEMRKFEEYARRTFTEWDPDDVGVPNPDKVPLNYFQMFWWKIGYFLGAFFMLPHYLVAKIFQGVGNTDVGLMHWLCGVWVILWLGFHAGVQYFKEKNNDDDDNIFIKASRFLTALILGPLPFVHPNLLLKVGTDDDCNFGNIPYVDTLLYGAAIICAVLGVVLIFMTILNGSYWWWFLIPWVPFPLLLYNYMAKMRKGDNVIWKKSKDDNNPSVGDKWINILDSLKNIIVPIFKLFMSFPMLVSILCWGIGTWFLTPILAGAFNIFWTIANITIPLNFIFAENNFLKSLKSFFKFFKILIPCIMVTALIFWSLKVGLLTYEMLSEDKEGIHFKKSVFITSFFSDKQIKEYLDGDDLGTKVYSTFASIFILLAIGISKYSISQIFQN